MQKICDDAFDLLDAVNNCGRPGELFPSYKTKCRVEIESCAWLVDCPGLSGTMFRGTQSRDRAIAFSKVTLTEKKIDCGMEHRQWAFVCCGYYCN